MNALYIYIYIYIHKYIAGVSARTSKRPRVRRGPLTDVTGSNWRDSLNMGYIWNVWVKNMESESGYGISMGSVGLVYGR